MLSQEADPAIQANPVVVVQGVGHISREFMREVGSLFWFMVHTLGETVERMREGLKKLGYGNMEIGNVVDRFWLDGPLAISAVEQTEFLYRLVKGSLPISPNALRAVKEITLLEKTETYELHGKTGWLSSRTPPQTGWWVGWIERESKVYPFALNIDMMSDGDAAKRISIGRECLKVLGKL